MRNLHGVILIWTQRYSEIFESALVYPRRKPARTARYQQVALNIWIEQLLLKEGRMHWPWSTIVLILMRGVLRTLLRFTAELLVKIVEPLAISEKSSALDAWQRSKYKGLHCVKSVCILSFLWLAFSSIQTEYGEIRSIFPYSFQMRDNVDQKNSEYRHFSHSSNDSRISIFLSKRLIKYNQWTNE